MQNSLTPGKVLALVTAAIIILHALRSCTAVDPNSFYTLSLIDTPEHKTYIGVSDLPMNKGVGDTILYQGKLYRLETFHK